MDLARKIVDSQRRNEMLSMVQPLPEYAGLQAKQVRKTTTRKRNGQNGVVLVFEVGAV